MTHGQRALVNFALSCLAVGGNGEGWEFNDAINALRLVSGEHEAGINWTEALNESDYQRLYNFVGVHAVADALDQLA